MHEKIDRLIRTDEPLAQYTSWRIGGNAQRYFRPLAEADLLEFLRDLPVEDSLVWLGLGSNVLIADHGIAGTVIHTYKLADYCRVVADDGVSCDVEVSAGLACAKVAKFAVKHGLVGAEFFAGIPGTIGGALAMNAGAFGGETWRVVQSVRVTDRRGQVTSRTAKEYKCGYREVEAPIANEWFLSAVLRLPRGDVVHAQQRVKDLLQRRNMTQPIGSYNCGSVFRNPPGKYAAELIEASKLKGKVVGNAQVSTKHANFIINLGGASAVEVRELIEEVKQRVLVEHGVDLVPEVRFIG